MDFYVKIDANNRVDATPILIQGMMELGVDLTNIVNLNSDIVDMLDERGNTCGTLSNTIVKSNDNKTDLDFIGVVSYFDGYHINVRTTVVDAISNEEVDALNFQTEGFHLVTPPFPYRIFA